MKEMTKKKKKKKKRMKMMEWEVLEWKVGRVKEEEEQVLGVEKRGVGEERSENEEKEKDLAGMLHQKMSLIFQKLISQNE